MLSSTTIEEFCESYFLENMVKKPICFKNLAKLSCIDLIITNKPGMLCNAKAYETDLPDCNKLIVSIMKLSSKKRPQRMIKYRVYKKFSNEHFKNYLN